MKKILSTPLLSTISSLILFAGVPLLYAWSGPTATPPANNVSAPINVSNTSQNKLGALGLGGLAVFGKSLFTETNGYALPTATKPTMLLGVNGAVGAKEYCDEKGQNCVTTLGGVSGGNSVSTIPAPSGAQVLPGWPNKIVCSQTTGTHLTLDISAWNTSNVGYSDKQDRGFWIRFYKKDKKYMDSGLGDISYAYGAQCVGKDLTDPVFTWY